jgi:hypothetical protein
VSHVIYHAPVPIGPSRHNPDTLSLIATEQTSICISTGSPPLPNPSNNTPSQLHEGGAITTTATPPSPHLAKTAHHSPTTTQQSKTHFLPSWGIHATIKEGESSSFQSRSHSQYHAAEQPHSRASHSARTNAAHDDIIQT